MTERLTQSELRCATCDGTHWVPVPGQRFVKRCPVCYEPRRYADGVPAIERDTILTSVMSRSGNHVALEVADGFLADVKDLFLSGPVGTGKTKIAIALLNEFYAQHGTGLFVRVPKALHQLQPGNLSDEQRQAQLRRLSTEPLLVLDDVGSERDIATDFTRRTLLMLYEDRGDAGLRTIFTSNLSLDLLAKQQGDDRLASRIAGRATLVLVGGADFRLRLSAVE